VFIPEMALSLILSKVWKKLPTDQAVRRHKIRLRCDWYEISQKLSSVHRHCATFIKLLQSSDSLGEAAKACNDIFLSA
jgi:hypothetical protein